MRPVNLKFFLCFVCFFLQGTVDMGYFLQNFGQHSSCVAYFAKVLQMNTLCSAGYISRAHLYVYTQARLHLHHPRLTQNDWRLSPWVLDLTLGQLFGICGQSDTGTSFYLNTLVFPCSFIRLSLTLCTLSSSQHH